MKLTTLFLAGIGITFVVSGLVVVYLRSYLKKILIDLCGTAERADFWMAFSNVTLLLTPLICALHFRPEKVYQASEVFAVADQVEWACIGLVLAVAVLGVVLSRFIARKEFLSRPVPGQRNA